MAHLFHLFLDVHVSIFKIRPGISGIFLTKLCLFFPFFFLSLFDHLWLSYSLIPATTAEKLSTQSKIFPFVYWKLLAQGLLILRGCHLPRGISWFLKLPHLINQNKTGLSVVGKISEMTSSSPKYPDLIFQICEYDDISCCDFVFCCMAQLPLKQDYPGGLDIITWILKSRGVVGDLESEGSCCEGEGARWKAGGGMLVDRWANKEMETLVSPVTTRK